FNNLKEIHFSVLFLKRFFNTEKNTVKKIFEFLDEFKLNLIHAHAIWNGGYIAMELAKIIKYKYVITEHMGHFPWKIPLFINKKNQLTNRIKLPLENADALLAVSNSLADRIAQFNIKRPIVLYNLVNEQRFKPNNWPKTSLFNLLSIGRLTTQNGMDVLLHAFSNAYKSLPNLRLTILGDWKQKVELMHLIQKLAITNVVNLVGAVVRSKIIDYYHDAQCFILASRGGNVWVGYAEAIACGLPIIATACGGPIDSVNHKNEILTKIDVVDDLTKAIIMVYQQIDGYDGTLIRDDFLQKFSSSKICEQLIKLYQGLV
ncbi:MAG: group 1 glycosyl transferase, partial [Pseudomonadota bacterium]